MTRIITDPYFYLMGLAFLCFGIFGYIISRK